MESEADWDQSAKEQPVREQLRKTKIDAEPSIIENLKNAPTSGVSDPHVPLNDSVNDDVPEPSNGNRDRPSRKRSRENLARDGGEEANGSSTKHLRKRSRDDGSEADSMDPSLNQLSHKEYSAPSETDATKSNLQASLHHNSEDSATSAVNTEHQNEAAKSSEHSVKQPRPFSPSKSSQPPLSSSSPAVTNESSSQEPKAGAFKSSGFASFASTSYSPFSLLGHSTSANPEAKKDVNGDTNVAGSSLKVGAGNLSFTSSVSSTSPFGSQLGQDTKSGGFGQGSKGLSVGQSVLSKPFGSTSGKVQPWGAKHDSEDEVEGLADDSAFEDGGDGPIANDETDSRFHKQEVETGEENENTIFSERAKIYFLSDRQWKEGGAGYFKMNIAQQDQNEQRATARFILRADRSHRLLLNSPLHKDLKLEDPAGGPPKGKTAVFIGFKDSKPQMMQVKMNSNAQLVDLYEHVKKWFNEE